MTDVITRAIALIEEGAAELQLSHTLPCDRNNWTDEDDARAVFDEHVAVAVALRQLRAELNALKSQEPVAIVRLLTTGGNVGIAWHAVPAEDAPLMRDGEKLYAAPKPEEDDHA